VLGNPLIYIDPFGERWFLIDGQWRFIPGKDEIVTDSRDANGGLVVTVTAGRDQFVTFNGSYITVYRADGSRALFSAVSGRLDGKGRSQPSLQAKKDTGPIPEGRYYFNPALVQRYEDANLAERLAGYLGRGSWPGGTRSWGDLKAPLTPDPATNTYNRSGFFIHGGRTPGSAGCIDLCGFDRDFFSAVGSEPGQTLVEVDYP
jgi:hypothetical protein